VKNGKVILGWVFIVVGLWVLTMLPVYYTAPDGTTVIHYLEIIAGIILVVLGIFNITTGREKKD
jgi:hypothetical protein